MRPTLALARALVLAISFAAIAYALGRPDLLALAAPFAVAAGFGSLHLGQSPPELGFHIDEREATEGDEVTASISVDSGIDLDAIELRLGPLDLQRADAAPTHWVTQVDKGSTTIAASLATHRSGRFDLGSFDALAHGSGLLTAFTFNRVPAESLRVLPGVESFRSSLRIPNPLAFAGDHRSRSLAPGADFAAIRPFAYGDSLRRVNWHATLKLGELHVTSTFAERSAQVVLVIDSSRNAGDPGASALDVAVRAASAITAFYLRHADSVRLIEPGDHPRRFFANGGRRQIDDVRRWLADVHVDPRNHITNAGLLDGVPQGTGALVIVLSPLIEETQLAELVTRRRQGTLLVAVNTLRDEMVPESSNAVERVARRLWRLEREMHLARLSDLGVPVVPWMGSGGLDVVLERISRVAVAPRMSVR